MFEHKTEEEARKEILSMVEGYYEAFHKNKKEFKAGDRISYASRVYDQNEMCNLVDSALEFWLTSGHYTDQFERELAEYIGVKFLFTGQFGVICEFIGIYGIDIAPAWGAQGKKGR